MQNLIDARTEERPVSRQHENCGVCMLVFSYYPGDVRVRREAEALAGERMPVDVICLKARGEPEQETVGGVNVYRLPMDRHRRGRLNYVWEYGLFMALAFVALTRLYFKRRYALIHVHNMPDVLVACAVIPRLCGAKLVLDLHDPTPEVFMAKYSYPAAHGLIRLLKLLEKLCIRFSSAAITPNIAFQELFAARSCSKDKVHIVMNSPQETVFLKTNRAPDRPDTAGDRKFALMFHGTIVERHGLDTALEALCLLQHKIPNIVFHAYGRGDFADRFLELIDAGGLRDRAFYHGPVPLETIAEKIRGIDIGLIPNKRSPFTEINFPTRIFEYLCLGKPVIVPVTRGIRDYFTEDEIFFFEAGNPQSLSRAILDIYAHPERAAQKISRGREVYARYTWEKEQKKLVSVVRGLLAD